MVGRFLAQASAHGAASPPWSTTAEVRWEAPARRVAPGQLVVVYEGDEVVASAIAR